MTLAVALTIWGTKGGPPAADPWPASLQAWRNAPGTIRTCDLCLRRAALYPLSYGRGDEGQCSGRAFDGPSVELGVLRDLDADVGERDDAPVRRAALVTRPTAFSP